MHEYSLVQALVRRVEDEARQRHATAIHGVKVSLGELSGVEPDLFQTAFELFRAGTFCENATLDIVRYPASWGCRKCGRTFAQGDVLRCPTCDLPARLTEKSEALLLESIDMEVP
jgi:hydrogenase nickel incorporation protein HypA/HybF